MLRPHDAPTPRFALRSLLATLAIGVMLPGLVGCGEAPEPEPPPIDNKPTIFFPSEAPLPKADNPSTGTDLAALPDEVRLGTPQLNFFISSRVDVIEPQALHLFNDSNDVLLVNRIRIVGDL